MDILNRIGDMITAIFNGVILILIKIFGSKQKRDVRRLSRIVGTVNSFEERIASLTDEELRKKTIYFREELSKGASQDDILPEAFAVVREVAKRTLNMRHFDVQIMGGVILNEGKIAEMATGEGKTLVATLPAYLYAISGKKVHIVTVNDYLAGRDAEWMGPIYRFLGLTVGSIRHDMDNYQRKQEYRSDIVYVTNNEIGFDYLRDNMAVRKEEQVLCGLDFAIVDEVDSIMIDEARTPLIISGPAEESTDEYGIADRLVRSLKGMHIVSDLEKKMKLEGRTRDNVVTEEEMKCAQEEHRDITTGFDFIVNEKEGTVVPTDQGMMKYERMRGIDGLFEDPVHIQKRHHFDIALRAHYSHHFEKDKHYVVKDSEVIIVDEFTGRLMPGRRWSGGLHQAVEAKEGLPVAHENQTLATITFQNFFKLYGRLAGMTGTALTEAQEFWKIYSLDVAAIPTNRPMRREESADAIYKTEKEKLSAIVEHIKSLYDLGRPVLVGTRSIEKNEKLSDLLKRRGIPHNVLNAKNHEREAEIIAQAGGLKAVTIATNMAGRGTDIILGGNPEYLAREKLFQLGYNRHIISLASEYSFTDDDEVISARKEYKKILNEVKERTDSAHSQVIDKAGLYVLGTERHESRRIDNQLRGRCGRQGDPGSSRFYLSLEDELMRLFGSDRIAPILDRLGLKQGEEIQHPWITRAIENAQKKIEGMNFEIRKNLLDYDNVMNKHREVIYSLRKDILESADISAQVCEMVNDVMEEKLSLWTDQDKHPEHWDLASFKKWIERVFEFEFPVSPEDIGSLTVESFARKLEEGVQKAYNQREIDLGSGMLRNIERMVMLQVLDNSWKDHLHDLDDLRKGIGMRAYGQKDPLIEYQKEARLLFDNMLSRIRQEVVEYVFRVRISSGPSARPTPAHGHKPESPKPSLPLSGKPSKIGRNDPCPCGSGKKYKKCCGK